LPFIAFRLETEMAEPAVIVEKDGHVLTVTLNRPEKRNAVNCEVMCRLYDAWNQLDQDDDLRVAILTGKGDTFCAGMDLSEIGKLASGKADNEWMERVFSDMPIIYGAWLKTYRPTKPVVLAVEGFARAGGTEILQGTDIRVAGESAMFGVTEVQRGLFPMAGSAVRLRRQIGYAVAAEMLICGEDLPARRAYELGLINHVVPDGQALAKAKQIAARIAQNGPLAVKAIVATLRETETMPEQDAFMIEQTHGMAVMASEDAKEGPRAFLEKRPPVFKGR
jgi:enoyl-CoA hydratase